MFPRLRKSQKDGTQKLPQYEKKGAHLALDDIIESIEELKHFKKTVFIPSDASSDS